MGGWLGGWVDELDSAKALSAAAVTLGWPMHLVRVRAGVRVAVRVRVRV